MTANELRQELFEKSEKTLNNLSAELANRVNQKHYIIHVLKTILWIGYQMGWSIALREQKKEAALTGQELTIKQ